MPALVRDEVVTRWLSIGQIIIDLKKQGSKDNQRQSVIEPRSIRAVGGDFLTGPGLRRRAGDRPAKLVNLK